jgi:CheY-like chemotaxis protein
LLIVAVSDRYLLATTGIGLVITQRLARLMRGDVGFNSVAGEGSEFWVELPVHVERAPSTPPSPALMAAVGRFRGGDSRLVLYVEDNPGNVAFMRDLLSGFDGIDLLVATTAEAGIELAFSRRPALIIMDLNLPGMSGLEALQTLQRAPALASIPVIALTAAATEEDRRRGERAGFYRYLTKPVNVEEFSIAIEAMLAPEPPS